MAELDLGRAVRCCALEEVLGYQGGKPSVGYFLRRIFRWYSRQFSTPLHEVSSMPLIDVLREYYEARYEELLGADDLESLEEDQRAWLHRRRLEALDVVPIDIAAEGSAG